MTFDKKKFDFMGTCVYQMVKHSMGTDLVPFEVLVQNDHRGSKVVSYTKLVEVKVYSLSVVISRTYQGVVMVRVTALLQYDTAHSFTSILLFLIFLTLVLGQW